MRRFAIVWLLLLALAAAALAEVALPPLERRVTDLTRTLSATQRDALERELAAFESRRGSQIAIVLLPSTRPETIEQFGIRLAEAWKLGRKGVDDGVILIVAKDDRSLRIEVGYGLEGVIPDAIAKRVIDEIIVPRFRDGDFFGGIQAGVQRLIGLAEGQALPAPRQARRDAPGLPSGVDAFGVVMIGAMAVAPLLRLTLGRLAGALVGGALAGVAAAWVSGSLLAGFGVGLFIALAIALGGGSGGRGGRWGGGSRGGGFSSGGGFSGGGGSFGGGGASGRW